MTWAQTYTGRAFDYDDPQPSSICIEDIAHALSMMCRFNGHTDRFYSVAEHSVEVADRIDKLISRNVYEVHPDISKWAILHDAAEAYTGDVVAPLKWLLTEFDGLETKIQRVIDSVLIGSSPNEDAVRLIKHADLELLTTEAKQLMAPPPRKWIPLPPPLKINLRCLSPQDAKDLFLDAAAKRGLI